MLSPHGLQIVRVVAYEDLEARFSLEWFDLRRVLPFLVHQIQIRLTCWFKESAMGFVYTTREDVFSVGLSSEVAFSGRSSLLPFLLWSPPWGYRIVSFSPKKSQRDALSRSLLTTSSQGPPRS
jgi:hypothetical protein